MSDAGKRYVFRSGSMIECKTILMRMDDKAIFELISTEGAYVRDLQLVVEVRGYYMINSSII